MTENWQDKQAIFNLLKQSLVDMFEIEPDDVRPEAQLYDDLDIDSIDAVDLVVHLKEKTGARLKPEQFRNVRTVEDVVEATHQLLAQPNASVQPSAQPGR